MSAFIDKAHRLNEEISIIPELGRQYQIGHTFFAEVVDIYKSYKDIGGYSRLQNKLFRGGDGPAGILWRISLEPILLAFLGNMDEESGNRILKRLKEIYG